MTIIAIAEILAVCPGLFAVVKLIDRKAARS